MTQPAPGCGCKGPMAGAASSVDAPNSLIVKLSKGFHYRVLTDPG